LWAAATAHKTLSNMPLLSHEAWGKWSASEGIRGSKAALDTPKGNSLLLVFLGQL